jgi:S1-C subfamily serine protease
MNLKQYSQLIATGAVAVMLSVGGIIGISAQAEAQAGTAGTADKPTSAYAAAPDLNTSGYVPSQVSDLATSGIYEQLYQQVSPSVVSINATVSGRMGVGASTGSGFVIDSEGHIVTNNHVVQGANAIEVELFDGTLVPAEVVGLDPDSDLAVLDVDVPAEQLVPVKFGDSDSLAVGESVIAIGSPFGQDWTLTTGIVSGLNRVIRGLTSFSIGGVIQTDAAINPGNSGGPLLDLNGHVIGVNSQILTESGSNSGVGFAIPGNLVQRVANELIRDGSVDYSYIGISGADVNLALIDALGLPESTRGVVITTVAPNGPADQAGLRAAESMRQAVNRHDVITAVDGTRIKSMDDLISYLARYTIPNQTVTLTVLRNGSETVQIPVSLASRPN